MSRRLEQSAGLSDRVPIIRVYCTFQKRYSDYIIMISYYFESLMDGYIGYVEGKNKL